MKMLARSLSCKLFFILKVTLASLLLFDRTKCAIDPKCHKIVKCATPQYKTNDPANCIFYHKTTPSNTTFYDIFEYDNMKCSKGSRCILPTQASNSTCMPISELVNLLPGNACDSGNQCASQECNNKKCSGKPVNATCGSTGTFNNKACNAGLYCAQVLGTTSFTCQPQKSEGESCNNNYACKNNLFCNNGNCTKALSLTAGAKANEAFACKTKTLYKQDNNTSVCADFKYKSKNLTHCYFTYNFNTTEVPVTIETLCTETEDKDSYCPLGTDSQEWNNMITSLTSFLNSEQYINAHVFYKDNFGGVDKEILKKIEPVSQYPRFKGADECTLQLYLNSSYLGVKLLIFIFALFAILI